MSQLVQLLALTSFQKATIKKYYQSEDCVKFNIFLVLNTCKRSASLNKHFVGISFEALNGEGRGEANTFTVMNTTDRQNE